MTRPAAADRPWSMVAAERIAGLLEPDTKEFMFVGAGPDGRDVAGALNFESTEAAPVVALYGRLDRPRAAVLHSPRRR